MKLWRLVLSGALALTLTIILTSLGQGFVIENVLERLTDAARWSNTPGSLRNNGVRGLGGGIEYAIASDFCQRIQARFSLETPKPTCQQLEDAIQSAFDRWASGHPVLRFVNVSDVVQAQKPPQGHPSPWDGFGAEIDFFASTTQEDSEVAPFGAFTRFWWLFADPIGTNNRTLSGNSITSADIIFNISSGCFHFDPDLENRGCNHFETLALHEIGHALGLDHPNEFPQLNWDTDNDPNNRMMIDCQDPTRGLKSSPRTDLNAVMSTTTPNPQDVRQALTNDDLGGRDFLYPICSEGDATTDAEMALPDRDGDSIPDEDDFCPDFPGKPETDGC